MRRHIQWLSAVMLITSLLVSGCSSSTTPTQTLAPGKAPLTPQASAPTVNPPGPKTGGRVVVGFPQEPDRFWRPFTQAAVAAEVSQLINLSLVMVNEKNEFVPALLTEVPTTKNGGVSADSLTWTLKLRKDVKWHDGKPFTSADVKFTYEMMMLPGTDVTSRVGWDLITSAETPDDYTVVFKFKAVDTGFLQRLFTVPVLPKHLLSGLAAKEFNANKWFRAPVGTGPFMFKEWVSGDHITVVKNPNYFIKGQPYLDEIVYRVVPDANSLLNMVETGEVQLQFRVQDDLATLVDSMPNATRVTVQSLSPWTIWLNDNDPLFKDFRTRQALAYGFDKEIICKQVYRGLSEPADGLISPQLWAYNPNIKKFRHDVEKAKALLDLVGWKDTDGNGVREAHGVAGVKDGTPFQFETTTIAGEQIRVQLLSLVIAQWKEIGVLGQLRLVDAATQQSTMLTNNNFQTAYSYSGQYPDPDLSRLYLDRTKYNNKLNYSGYSNPKVDEILTASLATADQEKRKDLLWQAQVIIAEEQPQLFVGWRSNSTAINKKLHGYLPSPGGLELWNTAEWWLE